MLPAGSSWSQSCYKDVFDNCSVGMALANVEGTIVHGNRLFCRLVKPKPQEPKLTVFNLTAQDQLSLAFQRLGEWLEGSPTADPVLALSGSATRIPGMGVHITKIENCDPTKLDIDCQRHRLLLTLVQLDSSSSSPPPLEVPSAVTSSSTQSTPKNAGTEETPTPGEAVSSSHLVSAAKGTETAPGT